MLTEMRRVINQQVASQQAIDNKAAKTVRLILLAAGVIATAFALGPDAIEPTFATGITMVSFALGTGTGVFTYTHTSLWAGAQVNRLKAVPSNDPATSPVRLELLNLYPERIEENKNSLATDQFLLRATQFLLVGGVVITVADVLP